MNLLTGANQRVGGVTARPAPPALGYLLTEPARGMAALAGLPLALPWLARAPRGDGHAVLVLPGLLASDSSTFVLRKFLRGLGYQVYGWGLGRNVGPTAAVLDEMPRMLAKLADRTGREVSVLGWSLGGLYARELARRPDAPVRRVVTLASPFALSDARQSYADRTYRRRSHLHDAGRLPTAEQLAEPLGVPSTAVFSRRDGIVAWRACVGPETTLHKNIEVRCGHLGFGTDPATLWLIADQLSVPAGQARGFRPPSALRSLYPARQAGASHEE